MDKPQKHYARCKKPDTKERILYDYSYTAFLETAKKTRQKAGQSLSGAGVGAGTTDPFGGDGNALKVDYGDECTMGHVY